MQTLCLPVAGRTPARRRWAVTLTCFASLVTLCLGAGRASAQGGVFDFQRLPYRPFTGRIDLTRMVNTPTQHEKQVASVNLKPVLDKAWANARGPLIDLVKKEIGKGGRWAGQTAHDIELTLAPKGELQGRVDANEVGLRFVLRGNRLAASLTTPDIAFGVGLDGSADPRFSVTFDLIVSLEFAPSASSPLRVGFAGVQVANASKPQGENITGDILQAAADLVDFLGGPDLRGLAQRLLNRQQINLARQINRALSGISKSLSDLPRQLHMSNPAIDARFEAPKPIPVWPTPIELPGRIILKLYDQTNVPH